MFEEEDLLLLRYEIDESAIYCDNL